MQSYLERWQVAADDKALFLRCYRLMTNHLITAVSHPDPLSIP